MSDSDNPQLLQDSKEGIPIFGVSDDIPAGNPWKNDRANRKKFAEKFVTIIDNIGAKSSAAILLEGEWGTGKSFFLKSFRQHLNNEGYKAIYFDAFAEDFSADPLLAICGQLSKELGVGVRAQELQEVLQGFMVLAGKEALRYHGINPDIIERVCSLWKEKPSSLDEYSKSRGKLEKLKTDLSSIVLANQAQEGKEGGVKPLVFIIDEMDRCRPTFALELLERVKHLFQVQGIIFVFGANKKSLMKSVCLEYGDQEDGYLQKFFDLELNLPELYSPVLMKHYVEKLDYKIFKGEYWEITDPLMDKDEVAAENLLKSFFDDFYYPAIDLMRLTLREAERSLQMFILFLLVSSEKEKVNFFKAGAGLCLILLKIKYPKLYEKFVRESGDCAPIAKEVANSYYRNMYRVDEANIEMLQEISRKFDRYFRMFLFSLAEGEEMRQFSTHSTNTDANFLFELDVYGVYLVKRNQFERIDIVRILENLDCRS